MILHTQIADEYLSGKEIISHKKDWIYKDFENVSVDGASIFSMPDISDEMKEKVRKVLQIIREVLKDFRPFNQEIWDGLFPDWRQIAAGVTVDLIVGFPEPYDAIVRYDSEGNPHVIFDLCCWSRYLEKHDIEKLARGLLTHEIFHVLTMDRYPELKEDLKEKEYRTALDEVTFNEGFAHLVSFGNDELRAVDWHSEAIRNVWKRSLLQMEKALKCEDRVEQEQYLFSGQCGSYYEKFACMTGMIYLGRAWEREGVKGLKKIMEQGYQGFAQKCCDMR